jgi:hypothetical protein
LHFGVALDGLFGRACERWMERHAAYRRIIQVTRAVTFVRDASLSCLSCIERLAATAGGIKVAHVAMPATFAFMFQ